MFLDDQHVRLQGQLPTPFVIFREYPRYCQLNAPAFSATCDVSSQVPAAVANPNGCVYRIVCTSVNPNVKTWNGDAKMIVMLAMRRDKLRQRKFRRRDLVSRTEEVADVIYFPTYRVIKAMSNSCLLRLAHFNYS